MGEILLVPELVPVLSGFLAEVGCFQGHVHLFEEFVQAEEHYVEFEGKFGEVPDVDWVGIAGS